MVVYISHLDKPITLPVKKMITLGRLDERDQTTPELDLTPFGAREMGVSRRHAVIQHTEGSLTLTDLDSANGTYLNGTRLSAHRPWILRDGDEICLGKMTCQIRL